MPGGTVNLPENIRKPIITKSAATITRAETLWLCMCSLNVSFLISSTNTTKRNSTITAPTYINTCTAARKGALKRMNIAATCSRQIIRKKAL